MPAVALAAPIHVVARGEIAPDAAFGGISGIDCNAHGRCILISDDRSEHAPARFYPARIRQDGARLTIRPGKARTIRKPDGTAYPAPGSGAEALDLESVRIDPADGSLLWSSEGDARDGFGPAVGRMRRDGSAIDRLSLPSMFAYDRTGRRGPRLNLAIEGLAFARDRSLWIALEAPLIEDGPLAAPGHPALVRLSRVDRAGTLLGQYAYPVDAVPFARPGLLSDNGVSEILAVDDDRLLILERSGEQIAGLHFAYHVRLYLAEIDEASDVAGLASLVGANIAPLRKHLLVDFDTLYEKSGNLEGMAWWPSAPGGEPRIILVNDNNYEPGEPTRFLLVGLGDSLK
jgi:hypothetical protein